MAEPRRGSSLTPEYEFDSRLGGTGRYVNKSTGRIVSKQVVTDAMESQITSSRESINVVSNQLANGEISLAQWQTTMRQDMKTIHTQTAALAKGGWEQMSQADWGAVGQISAKQYFYLQRFAVQIEEGKQKLLNLEGNPNGQFLRRADLYAQAGNSTYYKMKDRVALQNGLTEERRILDSGAQHCDCCIDQAAQGWQPIGTLIEIGGCTCNQNCRCEKEYRATPQQTFSPEYLAAEKELANIREVGEFYPGELKAAEDKLAFEAESQRIAREQGLDPANVSKDDWQGIASNLQDKAADELSLSTQASREAAGARSVGRRIVDPGERELIQVGGKTVEKKWTGGSAKQAAEATRRINRETKAEAQEYMSNKLVDFGYDKSDVDNLNYTQQRRLVSEIGRGELQAANIGDVSRETRERVVNNVRPNERAESLEIAYNPRAGKGLATWNDYETAMVNAGREDYIQAPPDNREQFIPKYVNGEPKYIPEFEF